MGTRLTTVAVRRSWGAIAQIVPMQATGPSDIYKNQGVAVQIFAGPQGAAIRSIYLDQLQMDNVSSMSFVLVVFRGELPQDISPFQLTQNSGTASRQPIAWQRYGFEVLYFRYVDIQGPSLTTARPSVNVNFSDGIAPAVEPGQFLTTLVCPLWAPNAVAGGLNQECFIALNVHGGIHPQYAGGNGENALRSMPRGVMGG